MSVRITREVVENSVRRLNKLLGYENPTFRTVGAIELYHSDSGYQIHRVTNESHGTRNLTAMSVTLREAHQFVMGMIDYHYEYVAD